ncbi:hypothetical protein M885DRAFT_549809 [Pelagophyceae sp. CCMP2097]|nr:hypothetical protein M885DRAFT_549809 [Pelagophyceae sp. CCMP2097]|mmetsp:Transcript_6941/g.22517  ORF Transcript_6941/g.22517 Transcript_6941/m.22517 type:complete len:367 (-) Transcript_6941:32-1132(-)
MQSNGLAPGAMQHGRPPLRVGIMGASNIGRKNARAIERSENCTLVAVASRDLSKARAWLDALHLHHVTALGSYQELLESDVQAVYLPLPTSLHLEWAVKAAKKGKHILIEKPVARTSQELEQIIACCQEHNVALLDGTMFAHHVRFAAVQRLFCDKVHWKPCRVTAAFTFLADQAFLNGSNIRTRIDGDALGCLGDVGWYCIRFGLYAFNDDQPLKVASRLHAATTQGVPLDMDVDVHFSEGKLLTFHCSFLHHNRQWFEAASGDGKIIRCDDFVIPRREEKCDFTIEDIPAEQTGEFDTVVRGVKTTVPFFHCSQEICMWDHFAKLAADPSRGNKALEAVRSTHRILDAAVESASNGGKMVDVAA